MAAMLVAAASCQLQAGSSSTARDLAAALSSYVEQERETLADEPAPAASLLQLVPANYSWHPRRRMDTGEDNEDAVLGRQMAQFKLKPGHKVDRAVCKSRVASDLKSALRHEIGSGHTSTALVETFTGTAASGIASFFIEYATVTLPNIFVDALVDVLCDIMVYGLVFAVASAVEDPEPCMQISKGIASEVKFAMPPAFTVYMTASISLYLAKLLVGYLARTTSDFIDMDSIPRITEVCVGQLSQTLSTSIATSVLGSLPHALTLTLTHSLTHSLTHYYYCTYCFYYGDYCQYCFYYRDYQWLKRMWWQGHRVPDSTETTYAAAARPQVTGYQPGLGHVPTSWTPPHRLDLKPGGLPHEQHPARADLRQSK